MAERSSRRKAEGDSPAVKDMLRQIGALDLELNTLKVPELVLETMGLTGFFGPHWDVREQQVLFCHALIHDRLELDLGLHVPPGTRAQLRL